MTVQRILIVAGTHGNEINPVWAVKQFNRKENSLNNGIEYEFIIGNPAAYEKGCRYIDVDLNRSFKESENFDQHKNSFYETNRANFINSTFYYHSKIYVSSFEGKVLSLIHISEPTRPY